MYWYKTAVRHELVASCKIISNSNSAMGLEHLFGVPAGDLVAHPPSTVQIMKAAGNDSQIWL